MYLVQLLMELIHPIPQTSLNRSLHPAGGLPKLFNERGIWRVFSLGPNPLFSLLFIQKNCMILKIGPLLQRGIDKLPYDTMISDK